MIITVKIRTITSNPASVQYHYPFPTDNMRPQCFIAAMNSRDGYFLDNAIADIFTLTTTTRAACDAKALDIAGGRVMPVPIQGNCSYSFYAGPNLEYIVQFRPTSLSLDKEVSRLAQDIQGSVVPSIMFCGQLT